MCLEDIKLGRREFWRQLYAGTPAGLTVLVGPNPNRVALVFGFAAVSDSSSIDLSGNENPATGDITLTGNAIFAHGFGILPSGSPISTSAGIVLSPVNYNPPLRVEEYGQMITGAWVCAQNQSGVAITIFEIVLQEYSAQNVGPGNT